jgi:hypothetical protein
MSEEIKEKAFYKSFSKLMTIENEIKAINRDIDGQIYGGLDLNQMNSIKEHLETEKLIWIYITTLTEKNL